MSFFDTISNFFQSIFNKSSPEVQKKNQLKKLETEIKSFNPIICKNGNLQANFGEALYTLYKNIRPLDNLFSSTISPNNIPRQHRFEGQLITTAYSLQSQELLETFSYENRKSEILADYKNADRIYNRQKRNLETVVKELNSANFKDMDKDILELRKFVEFCHFNFVPFLQSFDYKFEPENFNYSPKYAELPLEKVSNTLEDLYYHIAAVNLTSSMAEAIVAIAELKKGNNFSEIDKKQILTNLKRINFIITKVISPEKLKIIIRYAKNDLEYEPQILTITGSPRQEFADMLKSKFDVDEQRIKSEIQDERISDDVKKLFGEDPLLEVGSYNQTENQLLQAETPLSFKWILPLKILKTFLFHYMTENVKSLMNNIVIEGFFNNPKYKTDFSTLVYGAINADKEIEAFENSFDRDKKNSTLVLEGFIKDSKKDKDFYKKLQDMVSSINKDAQDIVQAEVTNLYSLYKELGDILEDAKKPSSEIISNLKVLILSSRNRDKTNLLEQQYQNWEIFFEIMKNYVIINIGDRN